MRRQRKGLSIFGRILLLSIIICSVIGFAWIGPPKRAIKIAASSVASKFLDYSYSKPEHSLPVVSITVNDDDLEKLGANLPWTGGTKIPVTWLNNGISHEGTFRYRGAVAPSHFLGAKKSFRLDMKGSNPYRPIKTLNVINPKSINMLNNHIALWIGGRMGVAVPFDELVFVELNGEDHGVMELFEQVNGRFERNRNLSKTQVPVYKGDFPPIQENQSPVYRSLWQNSAHWQYRSKADSTVAHDKLNGLIKLLRARAKGKFDTIPSLFADSLTHFIDIDEMIRFQAALKVINTMHVDNYHNQWLVLGKDEKFYPILWDPLMMFPPKDEPWYPINDALGFHLMSVPQWRVKRDQIVYETIHELLHNESFDTYYRQLQNKLRPAIIADPNKAAAITSNANDVFPFSAIQAAASSDKLLATSKNYWQRTLDKTKISNLNIARRDSNLTISWDGIAAIKLQLSPDSLPAPRVHNTRKFLPVFKEHGTWNCLLIPSVTQRGAEKPYHYSDRTYYDVSNPEFELSVQGVTGTITFLNAISDEEISKK